LQTDIAFAESECTLPEAGSLVCVFAKTTWSPEAEATTGLLLNTTWSPKANGRFETGLAEQVLAGLLLTATTLTMHANRNMLYAFEPLCNCAARWLCARNIS
jgi:hypothetical protein